MFHWTTGAVRKSRNRCGLFTDNNVPTIIVFCFQKHVRYLDIIFKYTLRSIGIQWELLAENLRYFEKFYPLYASIWYYSQVP